MTEVFKGATDQTFYFKMVDSAAGTPETGLTITNIDATYTRNRAAAVKNDLTALAAADSAHTDNKGIEVDNTNAPGLYRVDFPDAAFATGADKVILSVTCSGCDPAHLHIDLVNINNQVAYAPNAAADAAGGLPISDAGALDLDARLDAAVSSRMATYTQPTGFLAATFPGTVASTTNLTAGTITTATNVTNISAGGIVAASFAANAITAAKLDPDVTTELQAGLATQASVDDLPTNAELATALGTADDATLAAIAALNNLSAAQVNAEVDAALADINLDHLVKIAVDTNFATTVHADSVVGQIADNGAGFDRSTDSLEAIRDRGDAAWTTATGFSTHSASDVWAVGTRLLTAGTNIVLAKGTGVTGFNDLSAAQVNTETDTALADVGLTTTITGRIDAAVSTRASQTSVDTIDDFLDTEVGAIKTQTDKLTFDGTNHIVADARKISTSSTAADNLESGAEALVETTCAAGSTTTSIVTNLTEATDDHYNGRVITFTTGALAGQATSISDYNGTTKTLSVVALTEAPAENDVFVIS